MMNAVVVPLLAYLLLYKYVAIFVVMFVASVILPLPTNSLLLATGALASQGYFTFSLAVVVAVGGNVAGDCFDYVLARRYGRRALRMLKVHTPWYVVHLERYMRDYAGLTIFFTRFFATADSFISILAGFSGISVGTFLWYSVLGNLVSDGGVLYIGYFFGANWQEVTGTVSLVEWILLGVFVVCVVMVALWYRRRTKRRR